MKILHLEETSEGYPHRAGPYTDPMGDCIAEFTGSGFGYVLKPELTEGFTHYEWSFSDGSGGRVRPIAELRREILSFLAKYKKEER